MKVIDLLNKIANGEEVPENIEFKGEQYSFYRNNYNYCDEYNCERWLFDDLYKVTDILNDEIELIVDNTIDIESIEEVNHYNVISAIRGKTEENIDEELKLYSLAINKLVQAVKQHEKEIKYLKER